MFNCLSMLSGCIKNGKHLNRSQYDCLDIPGYIGDKIGYKPVLLLTIIGIGATSTCFDLTPRYRERIPTAVFSKNESDIYHLSSFKWGFPKEINGTFEWCQQSVPVADQDFFADIVDYVEHCKLSAEEVDEVEVDFRSLNVTKEISGYYCTVGALGAEENSM